MLNSFSGDSFANPSLMVNVRGIALQPIEIDGTRYTTFAQIDQVHGRPAGTAARTFRLNRDRFMDGKDARPTLYVDLQKSGFENPNPNGMILLTGSGYFKVVKTFRDDVAWEIYEEMIERFFIVQSGTVAPAVDFDDTETLQKMLLAHMSEKLALKQRVQVVETRNLALTAAIEVLEPKAEEFERFIAAKTNVTIEVFVKRMASIGYDIGRTRCFAWMRAEEIIEKRSTLPYQEYIDAGHFTIRETVQTLADGSTRIREQTLVTPKGQVWLAKRLQKSYRKPSEGKR